MKKLTVGIDLGTVNTCVATFDGFKVKILEIDNGRTIPSSVCFSPTSTDLYVGKAAEAKNQKHILVDAKRFIGRRFEDPYVQEIYKKYAFNISGEKDNKIYFNIKHDNKDVKKRPEDVSTELLKHVKNRLITNLDADLIEAIITVPAHFNNNQREETKLAAVAAGIKVLKLINEPTAAAIKYFSKGVNKTVKAMVFDLGGGTFDISIININELNIEVQATDGDTFLGGRDIDENVTNYFINELQDKNKNLSESQKDRLRAASKKLKEGLSFKEVAEQTIENFSHNNDQTLKLNRATFNDINKNLFEKCLNIMENCLKSKFIKKEEIDEIILVGGSSKIPKLQEMLTEYFGNKKLKLDIDVDEAVAGGAAIIAYLLSKENQSNEPSTIILQNLNIVDVCSLSLGIDTVFDNMCTIIARNSPLPITATQKVYTSYNNQTKATFRIFEGERKHVDYNHLLGELILLDLPPKPARKVCVEVTFKINEEGILNVSACYGKNRVETKLNIYDLNRHVGKTRILEAGKEEEYDKKFTKFVTLKLELLDICNKKLVFGADKLISILESTDMNESHKILKAINNVNSEKIRKKLLASWTKYLNDSIV